VVRLTPKDARDHLINSYFIKAGYSVVDLMNLNPGTQITYIVAMYISVYPVAILMRNSNVYQVMNSLVQVNIV
jgi:Trk-type K+ transport system membrane component